MTPLRRHLLAALGLAVPSLGLLGGLARPSRDGPTLRSAARSRGLTFGTALRETDDVWRPERAEFLKANADLYVPGVAALPDHIQREAGRFTLGPLTRFIARAEADAKAFRLHALLYPKRDRPSVVAAIDSGNWRRQMDVHFEAIRSVPGAGRAASIDVVNELVSASASDTDGYRPNAWYRAAGGPQYIVHAFRKARELWPDTPLYFCIDQTEQITDGWHRRHVAHVLAALADALEAGAPIDGLNTQGHLTFRIGFDAEAFDAYMQTVTRRLGLKVIIGEFDVRTGFSRGLLEDTPMPAAYSIRAYDARAAELGRQYLAAALPYATGGELVTWGLADVDSSWERPPVPPGERPLPWDRNYRPKALHAAMIAALGAET